MIKSSLRAAMVMLGSAGYLGLAILGWGGFGGFFADPARDALAAGLGAIAVASCFAGGNVSSGVKEDRGNRWVLAVFGVIGLLQGIVPAWTDRLDVWCVGGEAVRWAGFVLYLIGAVLRLWPVYVLGDRFSGLVAIQPGHTLQTAGIYAWVRNPSYLGLLVNMLGWCLVFRSMVGVSLTVLIVPALMARMTAEERLLGAEFGAAYEAYRRRTARLIPGLY